MLRPNWINTTAADNVDQPIFDSYAIDHVGCTDFVTKGSNN